MLKGMSGLHMLFWNALIVGAFHLVVFLLCIRLPRRFFDASRERYQPKAWEHNGRFYRDKLHIQAWKDRVPQHIGRDGFSKAHFTDVSIEYLDEFIMETCRGEWFHTANFLCAVVTLLVNPLLTGILVSFLVLIGNLPFAIIQRYNRFRIQVLRKKLLRDQKLGTMAGSGVPVGNAVS